MKNLNQTSVSEPVKCETCKDIGMVPTSPKTGATCPSCGGEANTPKRINREIMQLVDEAERQIQTFHGFRHLWAELVANHKECGVSQEKLEDKQMSRLTAFLGVCYTISKQLGITWVLDNDERSRMRNEIMERDKTIASQAIRIRDLVSDNVKLSAEHVQLWKIAQLLKNREQLPLIKWAVQGVELLAELRDMSPDNYDLYMKGGEGDATKDGNTDGGVGVSAQESSRPARQS